MARKVSDVAGTARAVGRGRKKTGAAKPNTPDGFQPGLTDLEDLIITYARQHDTNPKGVLGTLMERFGTWGV